MFSIYFSFIFNLFFVVKDAVLQYKLYYITIQAVISHNLTSHQFTVGTHIECVPLVYRHYSEYGIIAIISAIFSMASFIGCSTIPFAKNGTSASIVRRIFDDEASTGSI